MHSVPSGALWRLQKGVDACGPVPAYSTFFLCYHHFKLLAQRPPLRFCEVLRYSFD